MENLTDINATKQLGSEAAKESGKLNVHKSDKSDRSDKYISKSSQINILPKQHNVKDLSDLSDFKKKVAFTLSEVLITLAVVGVVAVMTLPSVINKTQERQFITAWKKNFAEISNACLMLRNDDVTFVGMSENNMLNNLAKYIKHTKVCREGRLVADGCAPKTYPIYKYDGNYYYSSHGGIDRIGGGATCMLTNRGAVICMDENIVFVDVNGYKLPNTIGKDIFSGTIQKDTLVFRPNVGNRSNYGPVDGVTAAPTTGNGTCQKADTGHGCSAEKLLK